MVSMETSANISRFQLCLQRLFGTGGVHKVVVSRGPLMLLAGGPSQGMFKREGGPRIYLQCGPHIALSGSQHRF